MRKVKKVKNVHDAYTPVDVLAISFEVYETQGFIKSGYGFQKIVGTNEDGSPIVETIEDNKSIILRKMQTACPNGYKVDKKYMTQAQNEIKRIEGKLMVKKLGGTLSNFEDGLIQSLEHKVTNFHISIIASIPNSVAIDAQRERVEERMATLKHTSNYVGKKGERYDIDVDVIDVKYIQSSNVYMITCVHDSKDVVKFWWREQPDITDIIEGKTVTIRGTVNKHELSKYTSVKETLVNRVKLSLPQTTS